MNRIKSFFSSEYLLAVPQDSVYEIYFLYLSFLILITVIGAKIYFKFNKRSEAYLDFDKRWFWGYLAIGLTGVFFWFTRNQKLPTFGTRIVSYLWLVSALLYSFYIYYYYQTKTKRNVLDFNEKKRKEKYLKR